MTEVQLFTDVQFTALLGFLATMATGAGVVARWGINRIVKAMDASTEARVLGAAASSTQAAALIAATEKVDEVHEFWLGPPSGPHRIGNPK